MQRTFTIETSEADERALKHVHRSESLDFAFSSILSSVVNAARDRTVKDAREDSIKSGTPLAFDDDSIILNSTLKDADARHADFLVKSAEEEAERKRQDDERMALAKAEEDARIRAAVEAALAERDAQQAQGDLFTEAQP